MNKLFVFFYILLFSILFSCKKNRSASYESNSSILFAKIKENTNDSKCKGKLLDSTLLLLDKERNDSLSRNLYLKIASEYYYLNDFNKSLQVSLKALSLAKQVNDSIQMSKAFYYAGDCFVNTKKDSAYYYYLQAEKIYFKLHDFDNLGRMLFNKAYVLFYDGNYVECEVEISEALKYLKKSSNQRLLYSCNTLMGNCQEKLNSYNEALKYHKLALKNLVEMSASDNINREEINNYRLSTTLNICNLYDLRGEYKKSVEKLEALLTLDLEGKSPRLYANVLSNLAYSKMKNRDYKNVEKMFFKSLHIAEGLGINSEILYKKIHIGEYFITQRDTIKAVKNLKDAYRLAIQIRNSNEILTSLGLLVKVDKINTLNHALNYISISDSINKVQKNSHNKYAKIEYETSKITDENKLLNEKNFQILIVSFVGFIILVSIFILRYLKFKNKEFDFFKKNQIANEEIYLLLNEQHDKIIKAKDNEKARIAKELHDGVMSKLYGVRMNLGFFNSKTDDEIIEKRKAYIHELQNIENDIRVISHDLSEGTFLKGNDFNSLLVGLIENQNEISETKFRFTIDEIIDWAIIENIYKINIYRIVQEAILNVNKYAKAKKCDIMIHHVDNNVELCIFDNGQGFDLSIKKNGIGLANMNSRANSLNGKLTIESEIGKGTKIKIVFCNDNFV